jgi:hypothetical protein
MLSPSLRGMPFSGVEWTYQARDLGFMEEIESDDEESGDVSHTMNGKASGADEGGVEMADLSKGASTVHKVNHPHNILPEEMDPSSFDSIMEDSQIAI